MLYELNYDLNKYNLSFLFPLAIIHFHSNIHSLSRSNGIAVRAAREKRYRNPLLSSDALFYDIVKCAHISSQVNHNSGTFCASFIFYIL